MRFISSDKDLSNMEKYRRRDTIRNMRRLFYKFMQLVIKRAESRNKPYNSNKILDDCICKFNGDYLWKRTKFQEMTYSAITAVKAI